MKHSYLFILLSLLCIACEKDKDSNSSISSEGKFTVNTSIFGTSENEFLFVTDQNDNTVFSKKLISGDESYEIENTENQLFSVHHVRENSKNFDIKSYLNIESEFTIEGTMLYVMIKK